LACKGQKKEFYMKITKFAALAGVALLAGVGAFAQATDDYNLPQGFTFKNEIGSDVVRVTGNSHKEDDYTNWRSEFGGIYDKITVGYNSEKLEFELAPKFGIFDNNENYYSGNDISSMWGHGDFFYIKPNTADASGTLNSDDLSFNYQGFDWKLRFTPFDIVDFWLHGGPHIVGSYLPARGTEWGANYLGSDGFAIITKPIAGLRISGAIPFGFDVSSKPNYLNAEVEDTWITNGSASTTRPGIQAANYRFRLDIGADYTAGIFGFGGKVEDIINAGYRKYGIYGQVNVGPLGVNLGYNLSEDYDNGFDAFDNKLIYIGGKQHVGGGVTFNAGDLSLAVDALTNLSKKESVYDLYAGAKVAYDLLPGKFNIDLLLGMAMDFGTNAHHGTAEDVKDIQNAMKTINASFVDLYYSHIFLEDIRAVAANADPRTQTGGVKYSNTVAASQNWQSYTALQRAMSNGDLDLSSASKAALALRIKPGFTYTTGKNVFAAHVDVSNFFDKDGSYQIKFPVSWTWNF